MVSSFVACVTNIYIANSKDSEFENKDVRKEHRAGLPRSDTVGWSVAGDAQTAKERGSSKLCFPAHRKSSHTKNCQTQLPEVFLCFAAVANWN